jgi:hypothetical protein
MTFFRATGGSTFLNRVNNHDSNKPHKKNNQSHVALVNLIELNITVMCITICILELFFDWNVPEHLFVTHGPISHSESQKRGHLQNV